jgi:hypothetical protein
MPARYSVPPRGNSRSPRTIPLRCCNLILLVLTRQLGYRKGCGGRIAGWAVRMRMLLLTPGNLLSHCPPRQSRSTIRACCALTGFEPAPPA